MSIQTLPTELLNEIFHHLDCQSICALRIACHALRSTSNYIFGARYFNSLCMLVTQDSLDTLEQLAANEFIRTQVRELWIIPDLFEGEYNMTHGFFQSSGHAIESFEQYRAEVADYRRILKSQGLRSILTRCISKFPNIETIGFRSILMNYCLPQQRLSPRCLGLRNLRRRVPCTSTRDSFYFSANFRIKNGQEHALVLSALLNAVVACSRPLKKIDTCNDCHMCCTTSDFDLSQTTRQLLMPLVHNLETLHLCQNTEQAGEAAPGLFEAIMIESAPSLQVSSMSESSWDHLYTCFSDPLPSDIQFKRLFEFHLSGVTVTEDTLQKLLRSAATSLRILSFKSVEVRGNIASSSFPVKAGKTNDFEWTKQVENEMRQVWEQFFATVRDQLSLEDLSLYNIKYCGRPIQFTNHLNPSYSGNFRNPKISQTTYDGRYSEVTFSEWVKNMEIALRRKEGPVQRGSKVISLIKQNLKLY